MDFYPIKKLLQQEKHKRTASEALLKSKSQFISPNASMLGQIDQDSSLSPPKYDASISALCSPKNSKPDSRFDQKFTLSWAHKQNEKRKDRLRLSPILPVLQKSAHVGTTSPSPLTKKNRRFVLHLASEKDEEIHNVPLYKNEVLDIRNQNERILKQIISTKANYQKGFNDIAQHNRFKNFRSYSIIDAGSISNLQNGSQQMRHRLSNATLHSQESDDEPISPKKASSPTRKNQMLDALSCSTVMSYDVPEKSNLLEGLEEIYQQDLLKRVREKERSNSFSGDQNLKVKNRPSLKKNFDLNKNYKNYFEDDVLMDKLRDPYGKMLPFNKPIVGNIRHEKITELNAIETKAEVLRNIKMIEESMIKDATAFGSLQKIAETADDDTARENYKEQKQPEKVNLRDLKGKTDKEKKDLKFLAPYMKKK